MSAAIRASSKCISGDEAGSRRRDLHYGAAIALRQVSLTVETGAVTCLLGRNGVGKTSLLRAIVGAHPISAGAIRWDGEDITPLPTYERARRGIAWVPQGRDIFPLLTVRENLETGFAVLPRGERRVPDDIFELFPVSADDAAPARRRSVGRTAAAARDRPRTGDASRSCWCWTSRPRASSPASSRTSAG